MGLTEKKNIAFIGGRGAGKSKLSRKFSKLTGRALFSTDSLVSFEAGGLSIARIVELESWKSFRSREYKILKKLCRMDDIIIDCGGGILVDIDYENGKDVMEIFSKRKVRLLNSCARIVYIKRDIKWLLEKNQESAQRPDLGGSYRSLIERRLPWYEECADMVLDMEKLSMKDALDQLLAEFGANTTL